MTADDDAAPAYRAFISYSHLDAGIFDAVWRALQAVGLRPWSDKDLAAGKGFTEQIQSNIAHSHLFVPVLTPQSHARGWVHQEIGYAAAMKVPIVPLCVGKVPEGMIAMAHAVVVNESLDNLQGQLGRVDLGHLVREAERAWVPPIGCAGEPEERAETIERLSNEAFARFGPCVVRVQGALSSFSLPDEPPDHPVWAARYGDRPKPPYAYRLFRRERVALERHAAKAGVKMIVNHGLDVDAAYGAGAKRARLCVLLKFLESLTRPDLEVTVALVEHHPPDLLLAIGDWFVAESSAGRPTRGVIQTVFTAHAPTVTRTVEEFDQKLAGLVAGQGSPPGQSRQWAIERLRALLPGLPRHPAWSCD